jgi:uncharacterized protein
MQWLLTFLGMFLFVALMAIGVMFGRKPIKGSCGGVGAALGEKDYVCDICGNDPNKCEKENPGQAQPAKQMFYDAMDEPERKRKPGADELEA